MAPAAHMVAAAGVGELIAKRGRNDHVPGVGTIKHTFDPLERIGVLGVGQQVGVALERKRIATLVGVPGAAAKSQAARSPRWATNQPSST